MNKNNLINSSNFPNQQLSETHQSSKPQTNYWKTSFFILLVLFLLTLTGLVYFLSRKEIKVQKTNVLSSPTSTPTSTPTPTPELKNVKTYEDNKYHFSFEYPLDWEINKVNEKYLEVYDLNSQSTLLIAVLNEEEFSNNPERSSCRSIYTEEHKVATSSFTTKSGEKFYCSYFEDKGPNFNCHFADRITISDERIEKVLLKFGEPAEEKKVRDVCERYIMKIEDYYYVITSLFYCHRVGEVSLGYKCDQPLVDKFSEVASIIQSLDFAK